MGGKSLPGLGIDLVSLRAQLVQLMSVLERALSIQPVKQIPVALSNVSRRAELQLAVSVQDLIAVAERDIAATSSPAEAERRIRSVIDRELDEYFGQYKKKRRRP